GARAAAVAGAAEARVIAAVEAERIDDAAREDALRGDEQADAGPGYGLHRATSFAAPGVSPRRRLSQSKPKSSRPAPAGQAVRRPTLKLQVSRPPPVARP